MGNVRLRKGKKQIATYKTAYEFANDTEMLNKYFPVNATEVQTFARRNAFGFAIKGSKARLGNGYILEAM